MKGATLVDDAAQFCMRAFATACVCREGDLVTIADKQDVHKALQELLEAAERKGGNQHGPRLHAQTPLPPLHLQLTPVASEVGFRCRLLICCESIPGPASLLPSLHDETGVQAGNFVCLYGSLLCGVYQACCLLQMGLAYWICKPSRFAADSDFGDVPLRAE